MERGKKNQVGVSEVQRGITSLSLAQEIPPTCACRGSECRDGGSSLRAVWSPEEKGLLAIKGLRRKDHLHALLPLLPASDS